MSAVWFRLRSDFRSRWRAWLALALLVGFAGGAAMTLAQAARRSEGAYKRFSDHQSAADLIIAGKSAFGLVGSVDLSTVARTGYVERSAPAFVALPLTGRTDTGRTIDAVDLFAVASDDAQLGNTMEGWKMLAGRAARLSELHEVTASFVLAERLGLQVGSHIELQFYRADRFLSVAIKILQALPSRIAARHGDKAPPDYADGPRVDFTVVGIEASPAEFPPLINDLAPVLHLTPAFAHGYEKKIVGSSISYIRLRPGRDLEQFQLAVERLAANNPVSFISTRQNQSAKVLRTTNAEALALAIVAALVGLAGSVAIGQALTRQALAESVHLDTLRALGMRDAQLHTLILLRLLVVGALGAGLAGAIATFGSTYALLPLARKAELARGPHVDFAVLIVGVVVVIALVAAIALWSARIAARPAPRPEPRGGSIGWHAAAAAGGPIGALPVSMTLGVRFALQRAARAVPAVVTMLAAGLAVALLVGALTFTANLHRVLADPHSYGWNWDVKVGAPALPDYESRVVPALRKDPSITDLSSATVTQIDVNRVRIDVLAFDRIKGSAIPTILAGRAPKTAGEIAVGGHTMHVLRARIGSTVEARIGRRAARLRVVGRAVFFEFGDAGQLGTGSAMTLDGLDRLLPHAPRNSFLVRFGHTSDATVEGALLARAVQPIPSRFQARPEDLIELSRGGGLLVALMVLLAVIGFNVLLHALVTSVRARRHELAVLRGLGLAKHHIRSIVAWQGSTLAAGALVIGVPLGLVLGRFAWLGFARQLGVASDAELTAATPLAVAAGVLALALIAAAVPASIAARTHPTRALHSE